MDFPCASFELDISQDHVEHKWPDKDGAHVEATGRAPYVFTAKAIFRNGTSAGRNENFAVLYPTQFRLFFSACADRTSGILQHPEFGTLTVKCKTAKTRWDANKRDGVDVDVVWVETLDPGVDPLDTISTSSPITNATAFALALDDAIVQYALDHKFSADIPKNFTNPITSIVSAINSVELFAKQIAGKINRVTYDLNRLSDAVSSLKDPQTWPISQSVEHLRSSLHALKMQFSSSGQPVRIYIVPIPSTLGSIAAALGSSISDIIGLNPAAISSTIIAAGTPIRYLATAKIRT